MEIMLITLAGSATMVEGDLTPGSSMDITLSIILIGCCLSLFLLFFAYVTIFVRQRVEKVIQKKMMDLENRVIASPSMVATPRQIGLDEVPLFELAVPLDGIEEGREEKETDAVPPLEGEEDLPRPPSQSASRRATVASLPPPSRKSSVDASPLKPPSRKASDASPLKPPSRKASVDAMSPYPPSRKSSVEALSPTPPSRRPTYDASPLNPQVY